MASLASLLLDSGNYPEAEQLLLHACGQLHETPSTAAFRKLWVLKKCVRLYDAWGKTEELAKWQAKVERMQSTDSENKPSK